MVRSLYSGVSGLKVHQTRMDVIGNNIANVNTAGFKASRVSFADIYYQAARTESGGNATFAGNNSAQVGYGAQIAAIDKDMSGGNLQSSNRLLDLAIAGEGFFCVGSLDENGNVSGVNYTRMGNFGIDSAGNLVNALNQFVLGRNNVDRIKGGTYSSTQLDGQLPAEKANEMEAINIFERIWDAFKPEAEMDIDNVARKYWKDEAANYYSFSVEGITVPAGSGVQAVAAPTVTDGVRTGGRKLMTIFEGTDPYDDTRSIAYDYHMQDTAAAATGTDTVPADYSVNVVHTAANRYIKQYGNQAAANVNEAGYKANVYSTDGRLLTEYDNSAAAAKATMRNNQYQVATDYILYTKDGKYMNNQGVQYDEDVGLYKDEDGNYYEYDCITTIGDDGTLTKTHTYTKMNEIVDQDGNKQYYRSTNAYDVYDYDPVDRVFASREPDPNGNILYANMTDISLKYSDMQSFNITETGIITAKYGGTLKYLARIDLATFENVDGLNEVGQTQFEETAASGVPNIKKAQSSGAGAVKASRLEMSNVSLADEFSDMIVTQRGFQANARIITTSDSMLEELVNMKR